MAEFRKSSRENLININHRSQFDNLSYRSKANFSHKHTHLLLIEEFYILLLNWQFGTKILYREDLEKCEGFWVVAHKRLTEPHVKFPRILELYGRFNQQNNKQVKFWNTSSHHFMQGIPTGDIWEHAIARKINFESFAVKCFRTAFETVRWKIDQINKPILSNQITEENYW